MNKARCSCGALTLELLQPARLTVACHCVDCQRRTGSPFGVGAFYPVEAVVVSGTTKAFTREAASGGQVTYHFCPTCGATVYWTATNLPTLIGVAVGTLDRPDYPAPSRSIFEESRHPWVEIGGAGVAHFAQGSGRGR